MSVTLTVCIPTYNFGAYIGETLASIADQLSPGVDIDILDGGSTDDTAQVVAMWQERHPEIRYHRQQVRGGIDRDMARIVELARGRYVWLFSADDIMHAGAISRVLAELSSGDDVYLCTHRECDSEMNVVHERHPVLDSATDRSFVFPRDRQLYFELGRSTEAFFSFMSGLIVRREYWTSVAIAEQYVGTCWAHAARLLDLLKSGMRLRYLAGPLLSRRGGNDSFADRGVINRWELSIHGYHRIAGDIFGPDSLEAKAIRRVISREFPLRLFLLLKYRTREDKTENATQLTRLFAQTYQDYSLSNLIRRIVYKLTPAQSYPFYYSVWKHARALVRR